MEATGCDEILIVIKKNENLLVIAEFFKKTTYSFVKANSGKEALKILREDHNFLMILLDVQLPVIDGFETAELIRKEDQFKKIPIIFLTDDSDKKENIKAYKIGMSECISKPVSAEILNAKISFFAELHKKDKELILQRERINVLNNRLQEQTLYTRSLIETSLDPIVTLNAAGKITDFNEALVKITGLDREMIKGTDFFNYFTKPNKAYNVYKEIFEKGSVVDALLTIKHKNGKLTDVLFNGSVYKDHNENVIGVIVAARGKMLSKYSRRLIEASPDPLITINLDGKITDMNEALANITGMTREKLTGTDFFDYFTEPQKAREVYQEVFAKGSVADSPLILRHKNGKLTDVLFNGSVYKDDRGNVLGVVIVARDVTAQKLLSKYSLSLIEASLDPLVTISTEGKITDMNQATVNITGMTREKLTGTDFFDYFTEPQKAREVYQEVFAKGSVADSPLTLRHKNGKLTDVLFNGSVYKDDRGNVLGVVIVARDITAQKQALQYARNLIEANLDPLVFISPDGKITDVNEASVIATGVLREKLIGTDFSNYFTEPNKEREAYQQVLKQGYVKDYSLTIKSSNGKLIDVFYNASVYKDTNGNVLGVFAAARDATAQKRLAEREVAEREKEIMRIAELEKFQKLTVGRELKMIELKKEIEELRKKLESTSE